MKIKNKNLNCFTTSDLNLSSYLYSLSKIKLISVDRSNPNTVLFNFEPNEIAQNAAENFWLGKAECIQPNKLFSCQRDLKEMIFKRN